MKVEKTQKAVELSDRVKEILNRPFKSCHPLALDVEIAERFLEARFEILKEREND